MRTLLLSLFAVLVTSSFSLAGLADWKAFFNKPNAHKYEILRNYIDESLSGEYPPHEEPVWKDLTIPYETAPFYKLVEEGNDYALKLAFQLYPIMSDHVGFLEAIYQSTSKLTEHNPHQVLLEMNNAKLKFKNGKYICEFVTDFGLEFVDRPKEELAAILARKELLLSVSDPAVQEIRDACIRSLDNSIEHLKWASEIQ